MSSTTIPRKNKVLRDFKKNKELLLLSLPGTIWFLIFSYLPMFGILLAFKRFRVSGSFFESFMKSEWIGLDNFKFLFKTGDAALILRNTLGYNLLFIVLGLIVPLILALALNEMLNKQLSKLYQSILFIPYFLSMVVVSYIVFAFLDPTNGYIDTVLKSFGMKPIEFYVEPKYWPFILTLVQLWKTMGYNMIIYLAAITAMDKSYYEAAVLDGASKLQQITKITIPMLRPVVIVLLIMAMGGVLRSDFGLFYQVPRNMGALIGVTQTIDTYIYRGLKTMGDYGLTSAASFFQSVVGLFLVLGTNKIMKRIDKDSGIL
ncbi:putative aldouronate transport system permease protein [Pilibacter termitis]|uniref:Putative aldouronate transport system permease protein n=1 Tax=Pilibacter termitis TaxID=263852 RepID=A0A1T4QPJ7_9ENTE|nr:ABC transporter permease subunit [Pilibacter termitis]SKA05178.1 putative aldouronate transport system permease protein [Pilibacter termitis]